MSNELAVLMQNNPGLIETGLDEDTRAVAGGGGGGSKRISIKGGVFRLIAGGKEIASIEDRHMNVIFVKMAHNASRTYYDKPYKDGEKLSPVCWSQDGKTPDPEVKNAPAPSCDKCPFSIKGSGKDGTGAACRLSWRTAVVLPNNPDGDVLQLVLPATSAFGKEDNGRWGFRAYVQMLANHNISAGRVVTKMQFDTKAPTPKLLFSPAGVVPPEHTAIVAQQGKSKPAEDAIKLTVYQRDEEEVAAPAAPSEESEQGDKPVVRETAASGAEADVASVVKKWSKRS